MAHNNDCGCNPEVVVEHRHCNSCQSSMVNNCEPCIEEPCECAIKDLSTSCVLFSDDDIECDSTIVIAKNTNLSDSLKNLVTYICQKFSDIQEYFRIVNVGGGSEIYAGDNLLGQKKLRTLVEGNGITIEQNTDTLVISTTTQGSQGLQETLEIGDEAILGDETIGRNEYRMTNDGFETYFSRIFTVGIFNFSTLRVNENILQLDSGRTNGDRGRFSIDNGIPTLSYRTSSSIITTVDFETPTVTSNLRFPAKPSTNLYTIATLDDIPTVDGSETKVTAGTNVTVTGTGTIGTPYIINATTDGSETKVNAGSNVTVTGTGTIASPYVINSTASGVATSISAGTNISVSGDGSIGTPYVISNTQVIDGSETKINAGNSVAISGNGTIATPYVISSSTLLQSGVTTLVTGNGQVGTPYVVETVNLQKSITADYTLLSTDNNYSIKANNGSTPITITVPSGLPENFFVGITQKGTADITLAGSGATLGNPTGLKIKGQGYYVGIEQIGTTNSYDLLGNTKS